MVDPGLFQFDLGEILEGVEIAKDALRHAVQLKLPPESLEEIQGFLSDIEQGESNLKELMPQFLAEIGAQRKQIDLDLAAIENLKEEIKQETLNLDQNLEALNKQVEEEKLALQSAETREMESLPVPMEADPETMPVLGFALGAALVEILFPIGKKDPGAAVRTSGHIWETWDTTYKPEEETVSEFKKDEATEKPSGASGTKDQNSDPFDHDDEDEEDLEQEKNQKVEKPQSKILRNIWEDWDSRKKRGKP